MNAVSDYGAPIGCRVEALDRRAVEKAVGTTKNQKHFRGRRADKIEAISDDVHNVKGRTGRYAAVIRRIPSQRTLRVAEGIG